jgi:hypothetical protein
MIVQRRASQLEVHDFLVGPSTYKRPIVHISQAGDRVKLTMKDLVTRQLSFLALRDQDVVNVEVDEA